MVWIMSGRFFWMITAHNTFQPVQPVQLDHPRRRGKRSRIGTMLDQLGLKPAVLNFFVLPLAVRVITLTLLMCL